MGKQRHVHASAAVPKPQPNTVPLAPLSQRATWAKRPTKFDHHYREDLACPTCGTDSTVGCVAEAAKEKP